MPEVEHKNKIIIKTSKTLPKGMKCLPQYRSNFKASFIICVTYKRKIVSVYIHINQMAACLLFSGVFVIILIFLGYRQTLTFNKHPPKPLIRFVLVRKNKHTEAQRERGICKWAHVAGCSLKVNLLQRERTRDTHP